MKNIKKIYEKRFLEIELLISIIITVIIVVLLKCTRVSVLLDNIDTISGNLYGTLITLSGTLLGFVITGLSILMTMRPNNNLETLKRSSHYTKIFKIFFSTSKYLGILLLFSLIGLLLNLESNMLAYINVLILWGTIISAFRTYRCLWVLENIINLKNNN